MDDSWQDGGGNPGAAGTVELQGADTMEEEQGCEQMPLPQPAVALLSGRPAVDESAQLLGHV